MIPRDPAMLLSYINTQLRDQYSNLEDLCQALDLDKSDLEERLAELDYHYTADQNQFI